MEEKKFSTGGPRIPSPSEMEQQRLADWETYGKFVPLELRDVADEIFNRNGKNHVFFADLSEEDKGKYVEMLRAYVAIPLTGEEVNEKERRRIRKEVDKLL